MYQTINDKSASSLSELIFHIFGALTEFECHLVEDRIRAALAAARARGCIGGRPKSPDIDKRQLAFDFYREKESPVKQICEIMNISKCTSYDYVSDLQNR